MKDLENTVKKLRSEYGTEGAAALLFDQLVRILLHSYGYLGALIVINELTGELILKGNDMERDLMRDLGVGRDS